MRTTIAAIAVASIFTAAIGGQELKPVPKDSMRVHVPGCSKGYVFTVGRRTADEPGSNDFPEGTHLRMNGPKPLMSEVKAHEGSMVELTGLMKKGEYGPEGIPIGGGLRIGPGSGAPDSGRSTSPGAQPTIDVESWRQIEGRCPR
jgi:hypothetical protein